MFRSFIDHAKMTVSATVSKYAGRIIVAALLLVAAGFALAAIAVKLSDVFGPMTAYSLLAGVFAVVALLAYLVVMANERHRQTLLRRTEFDTSALTTTLAAAAPMVLAQGASLLGRRAPLLVIGLLIAGYFMTRNAGARPPGN